MLYSIMKARRAKAKAEAEKKVKAESRPDLDLEAVVYAPESLKVTYKVAELKKIAKHVGAKGYSNMKEAEIVSLIMENAPE